MGEKTTEVALRTAAEDTAKQLGFDMIDFTVYPDEMCIRDSTIGLPGSD